MRETSGVIFAIGIKRVSSTKQVILGDSHEDQKNLILQRADQLSSVLSSKVIIKKWFAYAESASGVIDTQPLLKTLAFCSDPKNKIKYAIIKSIDRGTRGGPKVYLELKAKFAKLGVQLVDVYGVIGLQSYNTLEHLGFEYSWSRINPTASSELLESQRAEDDAKNIVNRLISAEIRYVQLGYVAGPPPPGYINIKLDTPHGKRTGLAPHPIESPWFIKMFSSRVQGAVLDVDIVNSINALGYKSRIVNIHHKIDKAKIIGTKGGKQLTVKQFHKYIQNPIYAGVNIEYWTHNKPIKLMTPGLVSIETFNKANRGKVTIIENPDGTLEIVRGSIAKWRQTKKKDNPLYPYKFILCPICHKNFLASGPRGKTGEHFPCYHCARGHKYLGISRATFHKTIQDFASKLHFSKYFKERFTKIALEEWEKRQHDVSEEAVTAGKNVIRLKEERDLMAQRIKICHTEAAIRVVEDELTRLDLEIAQAMNLRDRKEKEEFDAKLVIANVNYYMEHLEDLLLGGADPLKNAAMLRMAFEKTPTYEDIKNGTPILAPLFALNEECQTSQSLSVIPQRFEL